MRDLHPSAWFTWALGLMVIFHVFAPVARVPDGPWRWWGVVPLLAGVLLHRATASLFRRLGTTLRPVASPRRLVEWGPFRYTRNPMYLSGILILLGVATLMGSLTPFLLIPPFVVVITRFIAAEERLLEGSFGAEYRAYRQRVRRWI